MRTMKNVVLPVVAALTLIVPSVSVFAQTASAPAAQTQNGKKAKTVKFTLKNSTGAPMDLKSGDESVSLAAGESRSMKAVAGTKITRASQASEQPETVTEITDGMSGATVNVR